MSKKVFIVFFILLLTSFLLLSQEEFLFPTTIGIASGFSLVSFIGEPTSSLYFPSAYYLPGVSYGKSDFFTANGGILDKINLSQIPASDNPYYLESNFAGYFLSYRMFGVHKGSIEDYFLMYDDESNGFFIKKLNLNMYGLTVVRGNKFVNFGFGIKKFSGDIYTGRIEKKEVKIDTYKELSNFLESSAEYNEPSNVSFYYLNASISMMLSPNLKFNFLITPLRTIKIKEIEKEIKPYYEAGVNFFIKERASFNLSLGLNRRNIFPFSDKEILERPIKFSTLVFLNNFFFIGGFKANLQDKSGFLNAYSSSYFSCGAGLYSKNSIFILLSTSVMNSGQISSISITAGYLVKGK